MKSIDLLRRAAKERVTKELALPPGFKKIYAGQKSHDPSGHLSGDAALLPPVQDTDPGSSTFGDFFFMVGYD